MAALLQSYPALIAPAVHSFCQRDASQLKVIRAMRFFPPETCVWTSVTFTKCLYAMLVHRSYQPDQRTGWTLPPMSDDKRTGAELGIKLVRLCPLWKCGPKYRSISFHFSLLFRFWQAIGFELLANEESNHQKDGNYSIEMDPRWSKFLISLKDKGFFQVIWNLSVWNQFSHSSHMTPTRQSSYNYYCMKTVVWE